MKLARMGLAMGDSQMLRVDAEAIDIDSDQDLFPQADGEPVVGDRVVDHAAEEGDVRGGADLEEHVGGGRRAGEPRVHHNHLGVAVALGLDGPFEAAGVVLRGIPTHDQHHVGVLDIRVAIRHGPASERWSQT